jgi:hypothetical protein
MNFGRGAELKVNTNKLFVLFEVGCLKHYWHSSRIMHRRYFMQQKMYIQIWKIRCQNNWNMLKYPTYKEKFLKQFNALLFSELSFYDGSQTSHTVG